MERVWVGGGVGGVVVSRSSGRKGGFDLVVMARRCCRYMCSESDLKFPNRDVAFGIS